MNKKLTLVSLILLIPSSILVGLLAFLGSYSQLMADDFCSVHYAERLGVFRSVWYWYITWHGGYSAALADGVLGLFGRTGIGFVVPVSILIWLVVLIWMCRLVLEKLGVRPSYLLAVTLSMLVLAGTIILSPSIMPSLLWWGGLRGYVPPLAIFSFYAGMYLHFSKQTWPVGKLFLWCLGSFFVLLFNAGFSETFTPLQLIILAAWLLWNRFGEQERGQMTSFLLAGFSGALIGLVLMIFAPGNSQRQEFYPQPPALLEMMVISVKGVLYFAKTIFTEPTKVSMLAGTVLAGLIIGGAVSHPQEMKKNQPLIPLLAGGLFIFCCFPPAAYGQSTFPADHTLVIPTYILVLTLVVFGFLIGRSYSLRINKLVSLRYISLFAVMMMPILFSVSTAVFNYSLDIPKAVQYANDWHTRDEQIKLTIASGQETVMVAHINNWIGILEPIGNPKFFVNTCMSLYYDVNILSDRNSPFE